MRVSIPFPMYFCGNSGRSGREMVVSFDIISAFLGDSPALIQVMLFTFQVSAQVGLISLLCI